MYPTGSNGGSQAIVDARVLGAAMVEHGVTPDALAAYDARLCGPISQLILRNRGAGPFGLLNMVDERCGGTFANIDDVIPPEERAQFMAGYQAAAGFAKDTLNAAPPTIPHGARVGAATGAPVVGRNRARSIRTVRHADQSLHIATQRHGPGSGPRSARLAGRVLGRSRQCQRAPPMRPPANALDDGAGYAVAASTCFRPPRPCRWRWCGASAARARCAPDRRGADRPGCRRPSPRRGRRAGSGARSCARRCRGAGSWRSLSSGFLEPVTLKVCSFTSTRSSSWREAGHRHGDPILVLAEPLDVVGRIGRGGLVEARHRIDAGRTGGRSRRWSDRGGKGRWVA